MEGDIITTAAPFEHADHGRKEVIVYDGKRKKKIHCIYGAEG